MVKKFLELLPLILIVSLAFSLFPPLVYAQEGVVIIDGNKVYIDHKDYYLSATPAVLSSSGWVEFEFISKKYDSVDIVFQFPGTDGVETKFIQFQEEQEITYNVWYPYDTLVYNNVTGELEEAVGYYSAPVTEYVQGWTELDMEHVYTGKEGAWTKSKLKDKLVKGQLYKGRVWVDIPLSYQTPVSGKYSIGLKPWDKTIEEAESMGLLHLLDPWYNASWGFRKKFTIDGTTAGALTNYQVNMTIHYGYGSDSNNEVYLNCTSQADFDDIRITNSDGATELDIYLWNKTDGDQAKFWIELDSIPASPSSADFYVYCNNTAATSASNGANTFLDFDDFEYTDTPANHGWTVSTTGGGLVETSTTYTYNGTRSLYSCSTPADGQAMVSKTSLSFGNSTMVVEYYDNDAVVNEASGIRYHPGGQPYPSIVVMRNQSQTHYTTYCNGSYVVSSVARSIGWHLFEVAWTGTVYKFYIDGLLVRTSTTGLTPPNQLFVGSTWSAAQNQSWQDVYAIRKNATPEPTWGAWGTFETAAAPTVTFSAATDVSYTTATVHGNITDIGSNNITARGFEWDTNSGAPYANNWTESGTFGTGPFSHGLTSLPEWTTIYWRAVATSASGTAYSSESSFTTLLSLPGVPVDFTATSIGGNLVALNWTKPSGTYADTTLIMGQSGRYPTDKEDGWVAYNSTANYDTDSHGLSFNLENPYYRAWSYNLTAGFSSDCAEANLGGGSMANLTMFLVFPGIIGMTLLLVAIVPRRKNLLMSLAGFFFWLAMGFWWLRSDVFTTMGLTGDYVDILIYIPFMFALVILIEYWIRAGQVEIQKTLGGKTWSEFGTPPRGYKSGYEDYKEQLRGRTRGRRR